MKNKIAFPVLSLLVGLLFPFSSVSAFSFGNYNPSTPLSGIFESFRGELGSKTNPLHVQIQPAKPYCNYVPGFALRWFGECSGQIAQRDLQDSLREINETLNRRPVAAPAVVQIAITPPPTSRKPQATWSGDVYIAQPDLWVGAMMERDGSRLTFRVSVANRGDGDATNIRLTPSSDSGIAFDGLVNGLWSLGTLSRGTTREFTYTATMRNTAAPSVVKFVATGNESDKNAADNTETITIQAQPAGGSIPAGSGCDETGMCWGSGGGGSS